MDDCLPYAPPGGAPTDCDGAKKSALRTAAGNFYAPLQAAIRATLRQHPHGLRLKALSAAVGSDPPATLKALKVMLARERVERVESYDAPTVWRLP